MVLRNVKNKDDYLLRKMPKKKSFGGFNPNTFFLNEIKFLEKNNDCKNLVKALVADSKSKLLVLEFCKESDLGTILNYEELQDVNISNNQILTDVLSGIDYLHKKNYIHLDIRIDNIIICNDKPTAKISNFGKITNKLELDKKPEIFFEKAALGSYLDSGILNAITNKHLKQGYEWLDNYNYYISDIWGLMLISMQLLWYPNHLVFGRSQEDQLKLDNEILKLNFSWTQNIVSIVNSSYINQPKKKVEKGKIDISEKTAMVNLLKFCTDNRFKDFKNYKELMKKLNDKKCITSTKYKFL